MFRQSLKVSVRQFSSTARVNSFARAQLLGRIGQDIIKQQASSGREYIKYPIAVQYKKESPVSWFNVVSFSEKQNDFLEKYVKKGALVHVDVNITNDLFERDDGSKFTQTSFVQKLNYYQIHQPKKNELA